MYSGTVFTRAKSPSSSLQLPPVCWAIYDRIDGTTPIGDIVAGLDLGADEAAGAVQDLRRHTLIEESVCTYEAYRRRQSEAGEAIQAPEDARSRSSPNGKAGATEEQEESSAASDAEAAGVLHLPTLWEWLEESADNVKSYKNTQAFVLMEASEALQSIGVSNLEDLRALERCSQPEVVASLESAIENNVGGSIPDRCYR